MKTYSEKLKDPRWQRKRLEILQRDDFTCRVCGSTSKTLHVHHIRYIKGRNPWEYKDFYLVTLCEDCHEMEEAEIKPQPRSKDNLIAPQHPNFDPKPKSSPEDFREATCEELDEFFGSLKSLLQKQ